jgi:outer membrane lipoprotein SlyB
MNSQSILCCYRDRIRLAFTIAAFTALFLTGTRQSQAQTGYDTTGAQATVPSTSPPSNRPLRAQRHVARGAARGAALGAVGGAVTGDAGKGAAAGAAMGGLAGGMRRRDQRLRQN